MKMAPNTLRLHNTRQNHDFLDSTMYSIINNSRNNKAPMVKNAQC